MPPPHLAQLGSWDFSAYVRVGADDGLDPYSIAIEEPSFSEAPFAEGQPLVSISAKNREGIYPLFLGSATSPLSKDQLHALQRTAALACKENALRLQWRDAGATNISYFEVTYARFEPTFHYRRSQKGWLAGVLRIFSAPPYAHTATERLVASLAGTGALVALTVPSAIQGDVDAQPVTLITAGSQLPFRGDFVYGQALISHPSYAVDVPAASFTELSNLALAGASGAQGSQAVVASNQPADARLKVPLSIPSIYAGGRHRVMALAKRWLEPWNAITAKGPQGQLLGPTALATAVRGWQLVDLGVLAMPTVPIPSAAITIDVGSNGGQGVGETWGGINRVFIFPEDQSAFWLDRPGRPALVANDEFDYPSSAATLWGALDDTGFTWQSLPSGHSFPGSVLTPFQFTSCAIMAGAEGGTPTGGRAGAVLSGATFVDGTIITKLRSLGSTAAASTVYQIGKDVNNANVVGVRFGQGTLPYLSIVHGANTLASIGIAATSLLTTFGADTAELMLTYRNHLMTANLRIADALLTNSLGSSFAVASVAASHSDGTVPAPLAWYMLQGSIGAFFRDPQLYGIALETPCGSAITARNQAQLDAVRGQFYRQSVASIWQEDIADVQRGPRLTAAPSTAAMVVMAAPLHGGQANDLLRGEITMRERFSFAR